MRHNILLKNSTKQERIFYEVLKKMKVPFKHRWLIAGYEVDFLIGGNVCIEIDGHEQNTRKNEVLAGMGYIPLHVHNSEVTEEYITQLMKSILLQ